VLVFKISAVDAAGIPVLFRATRSSGKYSLKWDDKMIKALIAKPGKLPRSLLKLREHGTYADPQRE
jgi:hypothetical protein